MAVRDSLSKHLWVLYGRWVNKTTSNPPLAVLESPSLNQVKPLAAFRALREYYQQSGQEEASMAYFQTADAKDSTFFPRLTIIGVEPVDILQMKADEPNPFERLNQRLIEKKIPRLPQLPFFQGGALGYLSYDAVKYLEPSLIQNNLPNPGYVAEIVFYRYYFIFGHLENKTLIISSEITDATESRLQALEAIALKGRDIPVISVTDLTMTAELPLESMQSHLGKQAYLNGIQTLKHHILEGDIFQAVLSDHFSIPYQGDPLTLFEILSAISPAPYQFYFAIDKRVYLGASPEMLLKSIQRLIETHPIAGTRPRGKDETEEATLKAELLADEKEKSEHLMLVDLARNDIGRVAEPGTVKVDTFQKIRTFGGVMHLVSVVTGKLDSKLSAVEALASCFPAGTLSGAPKIRAMDLLTQMEQEPRGFYGGAFIAASLTGDLDSCIGIRCITVDQGMAKVQAGAGIVADSIPEKEYAEVQHKTKLTRKALALALKVPNP